MIINKIKTHQKGIINASIVGIILYFLMTGIVPHKIIDINKVYYSFPENKNIIGYDTYLCSRYKNGECERFWENLNKDIKPETKAKEYSKEILSQMDSSNNVSITMNEDKHKINVFINKTFFLSEFNIYNYDNNNYYLEKSFYVYHFYKVAYGDFSEKNNEILLGVVGFKPTESYIGYDIIGTKYIKQ